MNLGKGAALKTAFNHVLCAYPELAGVVTADADGQHYPGQIERVASKLMDGRRAGARQPASKATCRCAAASAI